MTLSQFRLAIRLSLPLAAAVALCVAATSPLMRAIPSWAARRWKKSAPPATRGITGYGARIAFPDIRGHLLVCPTPGRLDVHATADWQPSSASGPHWEVPFLKVRRTEPHHPAENYEEFEEVWAREYTDLAWESVPGRVHRREFRETLQLPPGHYSVLWGIRRYEPGLDDFGVPSPRPTPMPDSASSFRAIVR
jgi:hypothetical protein